MNTVLFCKRRAFPCIRDRERRATLGRLEPLLRSSGYGGYINLNTIVNEEAFWPLEFTCRFGYPGFPILDLLHVDRWDEIFARMISRNGSTFRTSSGYPVGVVLRNSQLVTAGMVGYAAVVTGMGNAVAAAHGSIYRVVDRVVIPNARYRNDIGERLIRNDLDTLIRLGWLAE